MTISPLYFGSLEQIRSNYDSITHISSDSIQNNNSHSTTSPTNNLHSSSSYSHNNSNNGNNSDSNSPTPRSLSDGNLSALETINYSRRSGDFLASSSSGNSNSNSASNSLNLYLSKLQRMEKMLEGENVDLGKLLSIFWFDLIWFLFSYDISLLYVYDWIQWPCGSYLGKEFRLKYEQPLGSYYW